MTDLTGGQPLLSLRDVVKRFPARRGIGHSWMYAVDGVSLQMAPGEVVGLVGESGSGKSTLARLVAGAHQATAGTICLDGADVTHPDRRARRRLYRQVQLVFQDPSSCLDPRWQAGRTIGEPLRSFRVGTRAERAERVAELLTLVGLDPGQGRCRPHQLSGGQQQRVGIARALALRPRLLVCDEPIAALDVSIQAQVINLLQDLRAELGLAMLFVAHDLGMVRYLCDRVAVMYRGRLVEVASVDHLYGSPSHPYTISLLDSMLDVQPPDRPGAGELALGRPAPDGPPAARPLQAGQGGSCRFAPRCPVAMDVCWREDPVLRQLPGGPLVACHLAGARSEVTEISGGTPA
jgi:oligopeptide/dipeptide ABC transporter ATP-binding protein